MNLDQLMAASEKLASFPSVVRELNQAINDPYRSLEEISQIIAEDPGLCARILKIANSSFYNFPYPINTITRAVTVIGTRQIRDLVTASQIMVLLDGKGERDGMDLDAFWRHSIGCAVAARVLAVWRREANVESYYLTGLLHDVGHLLLQAAIPKEVRAFRAFAREREALLHVLERDFFGWDHGQAGGEMLKRWNLPLSLCLPVMDHHDFAGRPNPYPVETAILHVADILTAGMHRCGGMRCFVPPVEPEAWRLIGLPASTVPSLLSQMEQLSREALEIFMDWKA